MAGFNGFTTSGAIIGAIFVRLRTDKGMTQAALAKATRVNQSTWSRIEKGESALSIDQLKLAAAALGVTPKLILEMAEEAENAAKAHGVGVESTWSESEAKAKAVASAAASGAIAGAAMGTVIPFVGTALGALIGGSIGHFLNKK